MTSEPIDRRAKPTDEQQSIMEFRADLVSAYRAAVDAGEAGHADELRDEIRSVDEELHASGVRGRLPNPDGAPKKPPTRSTRRRQDAPNLPRLKVAERTVGREYAGGFRPSMFITLTCDTYGPVRGDGSPVNPATYDYRRAARDAVHFASLVDRWWQNLRRAVGWDVQYFATVEPQKRTAPHLHAAIRGSVPHEIIRQVTAATYLQVWWPPHDEPEYGGYRLPVWDPDQRAFVDPDSRTALTTWADAVDQVEVPAHVSTFGAQVHSKGILGGTEEAGRHIGYLTKYLTKSTGEVVEATTQAQHAHHDRLHAELQLTPCSPRCAVWPLHGVQPQGRHEQAHPRALQRARTPSNHPRASRPPGPGLPEVVRQSSRRTQSRTR